MNQAEMLSIACIACAFATACGDDSGGEGGSSSTSSGTAESSASVGATVSSNAGSAATTTSSGSSGGTDAGGSEAGGSNPGGSDAGGSDAGGNDAGGGAGEGGGGGGAGLSAAECWAIETSDECYAAGCDYFTHPVALEIDADVCSSSQDRGGCFRLYDGSGLLIPGTFVRDFEAEGPEVIRMNNIDPLEGFTLCNDELVADHPACCCGGTAGDLDPALCEGITPIPLE